MAGEKTEKATAKKRRDERKKGNVSISKDLIALIGLIAGFYGLQAMFPTLYKEARTFLLSYISNVATVTEFSEGTVQAIGLEFIITTVKMIAPLLAIMFVVGIVSTGIQTKFLFVTDSLKPKFGKLNPIKGIKNLFSLKSVVELLKNLLKITILIILLYNLIEGELIGIVKTMDMDIKNSTIYMLNAVMDMVFQVILAFAAISGLDFAYQKWDYERQIKMSKDDIKEEYKQMEGDPKIKGKIRELQRQRAMSRMMQAVPDADVIIKNPTHYAVALKYDIEKDSAPLLLAKGQDELALRIIKVGEENGVVVIENKPLARGIYAATAVNTEISAEHYGAVAEILVYVFKLNNKTIT